MKVTQELMRHETPTVALGVYAQALTDEKRSAQNRIAEMIAIPVFVCCSWLFPKVWECPQIFGATC